MDWEHNSWKNPTRKFSKICRFLNTWCREHCLTLLRKSKCTFATLKRSFSTLMNLTIYWYWKKAMWDLRAGRMAATLTIQLLIKLRFRTFQSLCCYLWVLSILRGSLMRSRAWNTAYCIFWISKVLCRFWRKARWIMSFIVCSGTNLPGRTTNLSFSHVIFARVNTQNLPAQSFISRHSNNRWPANTFTTLSTINFIATSSLQGTTSKSFLHSKFTRNSILLRKIR